ncbi:16S rRNA (guanine(966)-N(2))-methyltransferase RsmD [Bacillus marasmi]|uniref:16S rRNA (guanine(966)-N(2))-methyltransferase RsmD n=1 Tax=Bacillus marasmi TaxID=1926279 RepID=UPI0011CA56EE|nr:16S rRNA (guanine(966)-N(2))-methyltransferase RsmD [Bacillus marasmi]
MRVVSGTCKGKALKAVPGNSTRPTTDKVKEAIFNMIGPYFSGGLGLDLFAGSGGLGIEALSRGLDRVIFVDRDGKAIQTIKENISVCNFGEYAEIYRNDANRALKAVIKRELKFDIIFLDPPYKKQQLLDILTELEQKEVLTENGVIVCEHGHDVELPARIGRLERTKREQYGIINITIFQNDLVE